MTSTVLSPCASVDLRQEAPVALPTVPPDRLSRPLASFAALAADDLPTPPWNPPDLANLLALDPPRGTELLAQFSLRELAEQALAHSAWLGRYGLAAHPLELMAQWLSLVVEHGPRAAPLDA